MTSTDSRNSELAERIATLASESGISVAAAESLTSGGFSSALGAAQDSSEWFVGGVVAYSSRVKHDLLGVPPGPVVSAEAATAMAAGVRSMLGSDVAVSLTGAGGPDPQDGQEPGTVYLAGDCADGPRVQMVKLSGSPSEVVQQSITLALEMTIELLEQQGASSDG